MSRTDQKVEVQRNQPYRKIDRLSYSAIKKYQEDRKAFYRKYILKKEDDSVESDFSRMGSMVDIMLTEPDNFDEKFVIASSEKPSGQLLTFINFLFQVTLEDTIDNVVTTPVMDRLQKAYDLLKESNDGKLRSGFEKFLEDFTKKGKSFFDELLASVGKTVVTSEEFELANSIVKSIKECEAFNVNKGCKKMNKVVVLFEYDGVDLKAEIDEIEIDTTKKIIYLYDYKVTSFVEDFLYNSFLKRGYYIQASLYKFALEKWKLENGYKDYKVENMAFKVACQNNYYAPLLYKTTDKHYEQGFTGFKYGNTYYKGIDQLLREIQYSIENSTWNISVTNSFNRGVVYIPEFTN
jgi:hypothetical protein